MQRRIEVRPAANNARTLRVFIDSRQALRVTIDVGGAIYLAGGISYGLAAGQQVTALLSAFSVRQMEACEFTPCGNDAVCVPDARGEDYTCNCGPGFVGVADQAGRGCSLLQPSCKTCAELGWSATYGSQKVCGESEGADGVCPPAMDHADADAFCTAQGARLCTLAEVQAGTASRTGCGFDAERTWAKDLCDSGQGAYSFSGNTMVYPEIALECSPRNSKLVFRCCADAAAQLVSSQGCTTLGVSRGRQRATCKIMQLPLYSSPWGRRGGKPP